MRQFAPNRNKTKLLCCKLDVAVIDEEAALLTGKKVSPGKDSTFITGMSTSDTSRTTPNNTETFTATTSSQFAPSTAGTDRNTAKSAQETREVQLLTSAIWIVFIMFGSYALIHYVYSALFKRDWKSWDVTDPGLYRKGSVFPNVIIMIHMIGGSYLMFAGPIQLIPAIRRKYIDFHKWVGRFYILAAVITSTYAISFCVTYSNGRDDPNENIGNVIMGSAMFICAAQSYRYIKEKNIELHKIWSYRLFIAVMGSVLYRLYVAFYYSLVTYMGVPFNEVINSSIFYVIVLPNLLILELIWNGKVNPLNHMNIIKACFGYVTFFGSVTFFLFWLPAILGEDNLTGASLLGRTVDPHSDLDNATSVCKASAIITIMIGGFIFYQYRCSKV